VSRPPVIRAFLGDEVIADSFAGGGGASTGIELALGRSPDIAVNHDSEAIAMHAANHPTTRHYTESVWEVDPRIATQGKPVALAWFSPTCTHFSKAKGSPLSDESTKIRGLAWVAVTWAQRVKPRVICIENVVEFQDWGPLDRTTHMPIKSRRGQTFRAFVRKLEHLGYVVEWRELSAADYGAPTYRRRLFLVARCDGRAIRWPTPTHGSGLLGLKPHRTAADCLDFTLPMSSIFERDKPLVEKTMVRIAHGIQKYVLDTPSPYVLRDADNRPFVPYLIHRSNGERVGQAPRTYDIRKPLGTIVAQGQKHALCIAYLARHYSARSAGEVCGVAIDRPLSTITAKDHHALVVAFLSRYNGQSIGQPLDQPLSTIDTRDRFALIGVSLVHQGERYVISDVAMRWLTARELFRCQGFSDDYVLAATGPNGKPLSDTAQKRMVGNSVSPPIAASIVGAQFEEEAA
jgi:DNA (cytosine-5)-methyltransferase 1